jgi:hypothetical protein
MTRITGLSHIGLALAASLATAAPANAEKVCYALQDLSTGFWGAGLKRS